MAKKATKKTVKASNTKSNKAKKADKIKINKKIKSPKKIVAEKVKVEKPKKKEVIKLVKPAAKKPTTPAKKAAAKKKSQTKIKVKNTKQKAVTADQTNNQTPAIPEKPSLIITPDHVFKVDADTQVIEGAFELKAGTSFKRISPTTYNASGTHVDGVTPYSMDYPFKEDESEFLFKKLIEMEQRNNPDKNVIFVENTNVSDQPAHEVSSESPALPAKSEIPAMPVDRFAGLPIKEIHVDEIIPDAQNSNQAQPTNVYGNGSIIAPVSVEAVKNGMRAYGKSIIDGAMDNVLARIHGGVQMTEFQRILSVCLKEYTYNVQTNPAGKSWLEMRKTDTPNIMIRIPEDENSFLSII